MERATECTGTLLIVAIDNNKTEQTMMVVLTKLLNGSNGRHKDMNDDIKKRAKNKQLQTYALNSCFL